MVGDRSRYGLCVSAVGAGMLAVSMFLPWYRVGVPAHAAAAPALAARLAVQDGYHALSGLSVVLLALAALALLDVLAPLLRARGPVPGGAGGAVVLLGCVAAACALYRIIDPPSAAGALATAPALREGAWLALVGSAAIALGGMWPRYAPPAELGPTRSGTLSLN